jgi:hypothetical protein
MSQQPIRRLSPLALPQTKKKRKPLGQPIDWSDDDLDALAAISPVDLKTANALWERDAPAPVKALLQAQVIESGES